MSGGTSRFRVMFFGEFGCGNLGNEASLTAAAGWFAPFGSDVKLSAFARGPEYVEREHGIPALPMYGRRPTAGWVARLPHAVTHGWGKITDQFRLAAALKHADLVLLPGMGVFESELGGPIWGLPFTLCGASMVCWLRRTPFAMIGVGGSTEARPVVRLMNRSTFRRSSFASFRDQFSRDSLVEQGARVADAPVFPDIAFGLRSVRDRSKPIGSLTVGIGMILFYDPEDAARGDKIRLAYEAAMARFASGLLARGHRIRILIGDGSDNEVAERLIEALTPGHPDCQQDGSVTYVVTGSHPELQKQIELVDLVVAARYHNLIFALKSGCPAIAVSYAPKCTKLMESAGFPAFAQSIETVDSHVLENQFETIEGRYDEIAHSVAAFARSAADATDAHRQLFLDRMLPAGMDGSR